MKTILIITHSVEPDLGKIPAILKKLGLKSTFCCLPCGEPLPENLEGLDGLLLMGSAYGVYNAPMLPWLQQEMAWLAKVGLPAGKPILGICFGAQLLSHMHGGRVVKGTKGTSFGYQSLSLMPDAATDPLFGSELNNLATFTSHNDVYSLPPNAEHLAKNGFYPQQATRFAERVYGVQFHPEVTEEIIQRWYVSREKSGRLPDEELELAHVLADHAKNHEAVGAWLESFLKNLFQA